MRVPRFYTRCPLSLHHAITLEEAPSHHLIRVLRTPPGTTVILFNGDGSEYRAAFTGTEGKRAKLTVTAVSQPERESGLVIRLGQGVSRGERMDLVMQKAVELGVKEITPLWTQRSQVQLSGKRLDKRLSHWTGIVTAASEQSGRVRLADLQACAPLEKWLGQKDAGTKFVLDPEAQLTLSDIEVPAEVRVLIGPEGGLERNEIEMARGADFIPVRLGPRTLRTETAAIATLAAMQALWGDFRN